MPATSPFELLAEELGAVAGRIEREAAFRIAALIADIERRYAERELQIERLQKAVETTIAATITANVTHWDQRINEKLASLRDGIDGEDGIDGKDGAQGEQGIPGPTGLAGPAGEPGPQGLQGLQGAPGSHGEVGERGEKGDAGEIGPQGPQGERGSDGESIKGPSGEKGEKGEKGDAGAQGEKGESGSQGERGLQGETGSIGMKGDSGVRGEPGVPGPIGPVGRLPKVKEWKEGAVHYDGDVVTHKGGLYQALQDTAKIPGTKEWICLASPGADGKDGMDGSDGRSLTIKDTYDQTVKYQELDVVTLDQKWFVAKYDIPGACPGPGWKAGPGIGKTGRPGERGQQGAKGETGPMQEIVTWDINRETYEVAPIMANGERGPVMALRDLFAQFQEETV